MTSRTKREIIAIDRHSLINSSRKNFLESLPVVSPEKNKILCGGCAKCCLHINHEIDPPENDEDCDYIIWFLLHENVSVWVDDENVWYIEFKTPCKALKNNLCNIYEKRPQVCREYLQDKCLNSNLDDDLSFNNPEEFLDYMKKEKRYGYDGFYKNNKKKFIPWELGRLFFAWLGIIVATLTCVWIGVLLINVSMLIVLLLFLFSSAILLSKLKRRDSEDNGKKP
ncbi:conserved hypothetical protein [Gammaproteobacteria bacterium]